MCRTFSSRMSIFFFFLLLLFFMIWSPSTSNVYSFRIPKFILRKSLNSSSPVAASSSMQFMFQLPDRRNQVQSWRCLQVSQQQTPVGPLTVGDGRRCCAPSAWVRERENENRTRNFELYSSSSYSDRRINLSKGQGAEERRAPGGWVWLFCFFVFFFSSSTDWSLLRHKQEEAGQENIFFLGGRRAFWIQRWSWTGAPWIMTTHVLQWRSWFKQTKKILTDFFVFIYCSETLFYRYSFVD